jgi:hypothetical protein
MYTEKAIKKFEATFETKDGLFNKTIVWGSDEEDVYRHINNEYDCPIVHYVRVVNEAGMTNPKPDMVNHPSHYTQGGIECIDAIAAAVTGLTGMEAVCTGNIIRYIWRWKHKNGLQDVQKCRWFVDKLIKELEEQANE